MKEERGTEDIWLCLIGVAAILGACGMTFDILFDMLLSVGSAGVAVGLGGSAESPQLTLLVYGALFFKPLFGVRCLSEVCSPFCVLARRDGETRDPVIYDFNLRGGGRRRRGRIFADGGSRRAVVLLPWEYVILVLEIVGVVFSFSPPYARRGRRSPCKMRRWGLACCKTSVAWGRKCACAGGRRKDRGQG